MMYLPSIKYHIQLYMEKIYNDTDFYVSTFVSTLVLFLGLKAQIPLL
jgi:hypothetical protein